MINFNNIVSTYFIIYSFFLHKENDDKFEQYSVVGKKYKFLITGKMLLSWCEKGGAWIKNFFVSERKIIHEEQGKKRKNDNIYIFFLNFPLFFIDRTHPQEWKIYFFVLKCLRYSFP